MNEFQDGNYSNLTREALCFLIQRNTESNPDSETDSDDDDKNIF